MKTYVKPFIVETYVRQDTAFPLGTPGPVPLGFLVSVAAGLASGRRSIFTGKKKSINFKLKNAIGRFVVDGT